MLIYSKISFGGRDLDKMSTFLFNLDLQAIQTLVQSCLSILETSLGPPN